jgi:type III secretion protein S
MGTQEITSLAQQSLILVLWISAPLLGPAALVGLLWSLFQAVTQLQDQTSSFVVKLVVVAAMVAMLGGWATGQVERFTDRIFIQAQSVRR